MRSTEAMRRRWILTKAQSLLDGLVGQAVLAKFMGAELDDLTFRRIAKYAEECLLDAANTHRKLDAIRDVRVKVNLNSWDSKLIQLTATLPQGAR